MKKVLFLMIGLAVYGQVLADEPHIVPAKGCPAGELCCPEAVVCDYYKGCGDDQKWNVGASAIQRFEGLKRFFLSDIKSQTNADNRFNFFCEYKNGGDIMRASNTRPGGAISLIGKWTYGFKKLTAHCDTKNSLDCTGKIN